jgi:hypothetical protein
MGFADIKVLGVKATHILAAAGSVAGLGVALTACGGGPTGPLITSPDTTNVLSVQADQDMARAALSQCDSSAGAAVTGVTIAPGAVRSVNVDGYNINLPLQQDAGVATNYYQNDQVGRHWACYSNEFQALSGKVQNQIKDLQNKNQTVPTGLSTDKSIFDNSALNAQDQVNQANSNEQQDTQTLANDGATAVANNDPRVAYYEGLLSGYQDRINNDNINYNTCLNQPNSSYSYCYNTYEGDANNIQWNYVDPTQRAITASEQVGANGMQIGSYVATHGAASAAAQVAQAGPSGSQQANTPSAAAAVGHFVKVEG